MTKKIIYTAILTALAAFCTAAQTPVAAPSVQPSPPIVVAPADLKTILDEASKQVTKYQETFRDLLATETKTYEVYNKEGELKDLTIINSNFLVYQSVKDSDSILELRNIIKVDDELVPNSQERADRFLSELAKTETAGNELKKIEKEGQRYDRTISVYGLTLFQGIALSDNLRPVFDFKLVGTKNYQDNEVYVINYQQTKKSPYIGVNEKPIDTKGTKAEFDADIPGALKRNDKFLQGKLLIDKNTFQIRRDERRLTVDTNTNPLLAIEIVIEYAASDFGILVPKTVSLLENEIKKIPKSDEFAAVKNTVVKLEYSKFRKTNVEVQISDDDN